MPTIGKNGDRYCPRADSCHRIVNQTATRNTAPEIVPSGSPTLATSSVMAMPSASTVTTSIVNACSARDRKSRRSRLSAIVAWTSTPANLVSSGVDTTSRLPSAVVPTKTMAFLKTSPASRPASTSTAEM